VAWLPFRALRRPEVAWPMTAVGGYAVLILFIFFWEFDRRFYHSDYSVLWSGTRASFQPIGEGFEGVHSLVLESLNPGTDEIRATYSVRVDEDAGDYVYVCPSLAHDDVDLGGSSGWLEHTDVELAKRPVIGLPGEHGTEYRGEFAIHPVLRTNRFPFDPVKLEIIYDETKFATCKSKPGALLTPPRIFDVTNRIPGFVVGSGGLDLRHGGGHTVIRLRLVRSTFLRWTAALLGLLGLSSTLLVARQISRKGPDDWAPLAYFVALWGTRTILVSTIPEPRPFPTLVDFTVLYFFALAFCGWIGARIDHPSDPDRP